MLLQFIPLPPELSRSGFDCGNTVVNNWFSRQAGQQARRDAAKTTIGYDQSKGRIASFYTIVAHEIQVVDLDGSSFETRRYPLRAMLIAWLGVDQLSQRQGVGKLTVIDCLARLVHISTQVGFEVVVVDAIDGAAQAFYARFGFRPLVESGKRMYITTSDLVQTFAANTDRST